VSISPVTLACRSLSEERINERRQRGRLREDNKKRKQKQEYEDRRQPPSLGCLQKEDQLRKDPLSPLHKVALSILTVSAIRQDGGANHIHSQG
jgi:hypothetical protein